MIPLIKDLCFLMQKKKSTFRGKHKKVK